MASLATSTTLNHVASLTTAIEPSQEASSEQGSEKRQQEPPSRSSVGLEEKPVGVPQDEPADGATSEEDKEWVSGIKLLTIMIAVTIACFLMLLDVSIVSTAIPYITNEFHSLDDVGWYGSAYQLASAALQPLTGRVYTYFNLKWTFISFFTLFEVGSLICGVATSSNMLIVGRAIAGMGSSGLQNGGFTIVAACVPMPKRPALIGILLGIAQLGIVIGPLIGGALTQYTTWRWCFYINLPVGGIVAAGLFFISVPEQTPKPKPHEVLRTLPKKLDLIGFAIFAPAAIQLLLALQYGGNQFSWNSATVIGLFCGAGATFILFLIWEYYRGDEAMIPFSMIRQRTVWSSMAVYGFLTNGVFCMAWYLPIYFQGVRGVTPTISGVRLLPNIVAQTLGAIIGGMLGKFALRETAIGANIGTVGKLGYYLPFSLIGAALSAIGYGLISTYTPSTPTGKWIGYQILAGGGNGLSFQMPIIAVQNTLPPALISTAMALVLFSSTLWGAMFLTFASTIFTNSLKTLIPQYAPGVNPHIVIEAGASGFRKVISGKDLANVLVAYAKSVNRVFYLNVGTVCVCFVFAWGMGWKDIRKKKQVSKA